MDLKIKEIDVEGERIHLKKSKLFGWGIVRPIKIDGKINWKNLIAGGSWIKLAFLALIMIFILLAINEYASTVKIAQECLDKNQLFRILP